ncbi:MAG: hypothetical protein ACXWBN_16380 [Acidimicrobiales bacterium]
MEPTGMTIIEHYGTREAAASQASYLVERGVGATVEPEVATGAFSLAVLSADAERAREVLGLTQIQHEEPSESDLIAANRPWLVPVLLIVVALFVIPVLAFLAAFKLAGG